MYYNTSIGGCFEDTFNETVDGKVVLNCPDLHLDPDSEGSGSGSEGDIKRDNLAIHPMIPPSRT